MSVLKQIAAVTSLNLKNISQRPGTSFVVIIGIGGVVAVLISVLAMSTGILRMTSNTGRMDRALAFSVGAFSESSSAMGRDAAAIIADAAGIRRGSDGKPLASAESLVLISVPRMGSGKMVSVAVRGIGPAGFAVRPEIRLTEGRLFQPAVHELIVGRSAHAQFRGLTVGSHVNLHDDDWTVVGVFEGGGGHDSELLADAETLLSAFRRNQFQSVTVLLDSASAFDQLHDTLTTNPALHVDVKRESDYVAEQTKPLRQIYTSIAYGVGGIMAIGALFSALNTMYSAVSARALEIATLRAIGFGAGGVVVSVFAEALLLAIAGALIGAALSWALFNGNMISSGGNVGAQLVYSLEVTPGLMLLGIAWAFVLGILGGLFPAIRAARLPVAAALRKS